MHYNYIFFDLDGTVLDTNNLILTSFRHVFKETLDLDVGDEELLQYFGEPLLTTLQRYSTEKADEMLLAYREYNIGRHDEMVTVFDQIEECIKELHHMGATLAIVTSKYKALALRGLKLFDLDRYFSAIIAMDDTEKHKPLPDPILKALEVLDADPEKTIMIGDSIFDIQCAKAAHVDSILVNWSMAQGAQAKNIDADYFVSNPMEIINLVKSGQLK